MAEKIQGIDALNNSNYKKFLAEKLKYFFGKKESITKEALLKDPSLFNVYQNLSDEAKERFDYILAKEDDNPNIVTEKEFKTLWAVLDANVENIDSDSRFKPFYYDQEISVGKGGGINITDNKKGANVKNVLIDAIFNMVKSRKEEAEDLKKEKEAEKKALKESKMREKRYKIEDKKREKENKIKDKNNFIYLKSELSKLNFATDSDIIKGLNLLHNNAIKNEKMRDIILKVILGEKLKSYDTVRDGGSKEYVLNNNTVIIFDKNKNSPTKGLVKIIRNNITTLYNLDGTLYQDGTLNQ